MKSLSSHFFIFKKSINTTTKCERRSLHFLYSRLCLWVRGVFIHVRRSRLSQVFVRVVRVAPVGLTALLLATSSQVNRRVFVGLGWMGVAAPGLSCFYMLFDRRDIVQGWFHVGYFYLFLVLAPSLFILCCLIGVWFLFPEGSRRAYALVVPAGFTVGKILWLIQCTSNEEFYSVVPSSFILIGALISAFLFLASDWLVHNVFHRQHAFERRIGTLYNGVDLLDGEEFKRLFKQSVEEKRAFQKEY